MGRQPGVCPFGRRGRVVPERPLRDFRVSAEGEHDADNHGGLSLRFAPRHRRAREPPLRGGSSMDDGEPPVLKGRQSKPWIPAFAGMTAEERGADNHRGLSLRRGARMRPLRARAARVSPPALAAAKPVVPAKAGIRNRGARRPTDVPGQSMRGFMVSQGRPPAAARRQWRGWGGDIVGAVREPPGFFDARADPPVIVRLVGGAGRSRTTPTGFSRIGGR